MTSNGTQNLTVKAEVVHTCNMLNLALKKYVTTLEWTGELKLFKAV